MEAKDLLGKNEIFSSMDQGKPLKSYKKTILGKLLLKVWDSLNNVQTEVVFGGDPRKGGEAVFDVFSEREKVYFERMNVRHFDEGNLIAFTHPEKVESTEKPFEQYSDTDLEKIVNSKYLSLTSTLNKINSVPVLFRIKTAAQESEKSDKIIKAIDARISEVQLQELTVQPQSAEDDELTSNEED